jgi:hypothetical protein
MDTYSHSDVKAGANLPLHHADGVRDGFSIYPPLLTRERKTDYPALEKDSS